MKCPDCVQKGHLNTPRLILAISQCSGELPKSPPGISLGHNVLDSGLWEQAAALQTFRCCCGCWGDLGQPLGVREGWNTRYPTQHPARTAAPFIALWKLYSTGTIKGQGVELPLHSPRPR